MLAEWLEKEAGETMVKTAAQQFEEELSALDTHSIAKVWRQSKHAADNTDARYKGALIGGTLGGAATGGLQGAALGSYGGPAGALAGSALGAAGGALGGGVGGHVYESEWGERHPIGRYAVPFLTGGTGGLGGAAIGARLAGGRKDKKDKSKEKKSSVDLMRLVLMKQARAKRRGL